MGSFFHLSSTPSATASVSTPVAPHVRGEPGKPAGRAWVPVRSLAARHRARIAAHLLELELRDRYLRFGYAASDPQITKYVDTIDFSEDEVFGIFNRRLQLIAMAHLAHAPSNGIGRATSEFGVSVLPQARGRGFGRRLFEHAILHAQNRGVDSLMIHALSENTAMLKLARAAGATVVREGSESDATLRLPSDTIASHLGQLVSDQAAEFDFQYKLHAFRLNGFVDAIGGAAGAIARRAGIGDE